MEAGKTATILHVGAAATVYVSLCEQARPYRPPHTIYVLYAVYLSLVFKTPVRVYCLPAGQPILVA